MGITQNLGRLKRLAQDAFGAITIEPMLFTWNMATFSMVVVSENFRLDRYCKINLSYSEEDCANLNDGHHDDMQVEVQKLDNLFKFYEKLIGMTVPVILVSFIAAWSDQRGRKVPMLMSIFGYILYSSIYLLVSFYHLWPPEILYSASFCQTIGGGWMLFLMAAYSYIADNSETKSRTIRMAVMFAIWNLGTPTGTAIGTLIYDKAGYSWLFAFSLFLYILCFIYSAIVIKNKVQTPETGQQLLEKRSVYHYKNVVDLFKTCFKRRSGRGRLHILWLISLMLASMSTMGHNMYLWSMRVFYWDIDDYTFYKMINDITQILAILITTSLLPILKLHDCIVGALTAIGKFTQLLALGLLTKESQKWVPYLFIVVPAGLCSVTIRSMISKTVTKDEVGRVLALLSIFEVFWPVIDSAIFTAVYGSTIDFYPSYEHLIGAIFALYVLFGFLGIKLSINKQEIRVIVRELQHLEQFKMDKVTRVEKL